MKVLKRVKQSVLRAAEQSGITRAVGNSRWRRERLLIIGYHGVSIDDEHLWNPDLYFSQTQLRERFALLRTGGCNVLPLGEALERLRAGTLPPRAVVLTFDDGNFDFDSRAWPLLQEFGYPATNYASTYYSEFQRPVFTVASSYLLWRAKANPRRFRAESVTGSDQEFAPSDPVDRERAVTHIVEFAKTARLSGAEKDELLERLSAALGVDYDDIRRRRILQLMTPAELKEVSEGGVDVQLHTHRHRVPDERALFLREIDDNRRSISSATGKVAAHFCYPSGVHKPAFLPWLRAAQVISATTCDPGLAAPYDDPLVLPRLVDTSSLSAVEYGGWLSGVSQVLPRSGGGDAWVGLRRAFRARPA